MLLDYFASITSTDSSAQQPSSVNATPEKGKIFIFKIIMLYSTCVNYFVDIFDPLTYSETFKALQSLGWIDKGKILKIVLEVLVTIGLASKKEMEQLLQKDVYSKNMLKIMSTCFVLCFFNLSQITHLVPIR